MSHPPNTRQTPRIQPYVAPCRVRLGDGRVLAGYVTEISPRGARVACDEAPPPAGSAVVVEVRFGSHAAHTRLPGEVKWTQRRTKPRARHVFGLKFTGVGPQEQAVLEAALDEFRRRAAQLA